MIKNTLIAFYGGTFDPIHNGHLESVMAIVRIVQLQQVILIPNNSPAHRSKPKATAQQRLAMVRLAIADTFLGGLCRIDERELTQEGHSWTVETFEVLRKEYGPSIPLGFIIGQDSLLTLRNWYCGSKLLDLCHILVCARPGYGHGLIYAKTQPWLSTRLTEDPMSLHCHSAGLIYCAPSPEVAISATDIRRRLHMGLLCNDLLTPSVKSYIHAQGLYF